MAEDRKRIANRIKQLQPAVSNRTIAKVMGVTHQTINNDEASESETPTPEPKAATVSSELCRSFRPTMLDRSRTRLGPVMATSETLLTVVAVTLAALVVAGLVAAADHPQREIACLPKHAVVHKETPPAGKPEADGMLRDMLLHD